MSRKLSLSIILLLAFLQCLAPLLHAHPLGASAAKGAHFHSGLDYVTDTTSAQTASHGNKPAVTEFSAIGMEKPFKPVCQYLAVVLHVVAVATTFVVLFLRPSWTLDKGRRRLLLQYAFPPSQAPPASF